MKTEKQSVNMQTSITELSYLFVSHWCVENLSYVKGVEKKGPSVHPCDAPELRVKEGSASDYGII